MQEMTYLEGPCGLALAQAGGAQKWMGSKKGSGDLVSTRPDFLTQKQNISWEPSGFCKSTGIDLYFGVVVKGYDFGLKGMNIFPSACFQHNETKEEEERIEYGCRVSYPL